MNNGEGDLFAFATVFWMTCANQADGGELVFNQWV